MKRFAFFALVALATGCNQAAPSTETATASGAAAAEAPAQVAPTAAIDIPRAKELLKQPGTQVLDVRTAVEYMTGHLPQAKNLNVNSDDFAQQIAQLDTSKTYVVYCLGGVRSASAAKIMYQKGFRHVVNGGGYSDLKE